MKRDVWMNFCVDLENITANGFKEYNGLSYKTLNYIKIYSTCKLRRVFTMKYRPPDTTGDDEFIDNSNMDSIPKILQFNHGIQFINQVITLEKVKSYIDHYYNSNNNDENKDIKQSGKIIYKSKSNNKYGSNPTPGQPTIAFGRKVLVPLPTLNHLKKSITSNRANNTSLKKDNDIDKQDDKLTNENNQDINNINNNDNNKTNSNNNINKNKDLETSSHKRNEKEIKKKKDQMANKTINKSQNFEENIEDITKLNTDTNNIMSNNNDNDHDNIDDKDDTSLSNNNKKKNLIDDNNNDSNIYCNNNKLNNENEKKEENLSNIDIYSDSENNIIDNNNGNETEENKIQDEISNNNNNINNINKKNNYNPYDPQRYGDSYIFTNIKNNINHLSEDWSKLGSTNINNGTDNDNAENNILNTNTTNCIISMNVEIDQQQISIDSIHTSSEKESSRKNTSNEFKNSSSTLFIE
jgi:hypothetical protein